jgi:hypothetical protein
MNGSLVSFQAPAWLSALALALLVSCGKQEPPAAPEPAAPNTPPVVAPSNASAAASAAAPAATAKPDFGKLKGKWLRPDGGYVLELRNMDDSGRLEAFYLNPRPIHVARAAASRDGAVTKVFIELRDVNYPGSTYTLAYDPANDQLKGIYFQAVERQNFEVLFVRLP